MFKIISHNKKNLLDVLQKLCKMLKYNSSEGRYKTLFLAVNQLH